MQPHAVQDRDGRRSGPLTRGPLYRVSMRDGRKFITGKDRSTFARPVEPAEAFGRIDAEFWSLDGRDEEIERAQQQDFEAAVRAAIPFAGAAAVARWGKIGKRNVELWAAGKCKPADPEKAAAAVKGAIIGAAPILYGDASDAPAGFCAALPAKAAIVQSFKGIVVAGLAEGPGGWGGLARSTGLARKSLCEFPAHALGGPVPAARLATIGAGLRRWAKATIAEAWGPRSMRRMLIAEGLAGDVTVVLLALYAAAGGDMATAAGWLPAEPESLFPVMAALVAVVAVAATFAVALGQGDDRRGTGSGEAEAVVAEAAGVRFGCAGRVPHPRPSLIRGIMPRLASVVMPETARRR